jgi:hypothetical protein
MVHKKFILALLVLVVLSACTVPTRENFDNTINGYHGMSVDTLVKTWGPPTASYITTDNNRVYQWTQGGGHTYFEGASYPWIGAQSHAYAPWNHALWPAWGGGMYNSGVGMFVSRPMTLDRSCTLNISANSQNVITAHQAIGSACVAD